MSCKAKARVSRIPSPSVSLFGPGWLQHLCESTRLQTYFTGPDDDPVDEERAAARRLRFAAARAARVVVELLPLQTHRYRTQVLVDPEEVLVICERKQQ